MKIGDLYKLRKEQDFLILEPKKVQTIHVTGKEKESMNLFKRFKLKIK